MSLTRSHKLSIGIVGLPNSGKSTIFNALTKSAVPAENYPFCTIDRNVGVVKIPDERLDKLAKIFSSEKKVPSAITFVDIAGLVKGAHKGEGLGNQFLSHIREADSILYVLRAFKGEKIAHVYERIDPVDDLKIVRSELILKDIGTVEKQLEKKNDEAKSGMNDELEMQINCLKKLLKWLSDENPAYSADLDQNEREYIRDLWLLTNKPAMYLLNIRGGVEEPDLERWIRQLKKEIPEDEQDFILAVDCRLEMDVANVEDNEKNELLSMIDEHAGVDDIINLAYERLDLITFYTGNEKEANAWTVQEGATAKEAAGVIHSDLEENFVAAEVVPVEDIIEYGSWVKAREAGLLQNVGSDYVVKDGDGIIILATNK